MTSCSRHLARIKANWTLRPSCSFSSHSPSRSSPTRSRRHGALLNHSFAPCHSSPHTTQLSTGSLKAVFGVGSHQVDTYKHLLYESDVEQQPSDCGIRRVVDRANGPVNLTWWLILMRFRARVQGPSGTWSVFQGMRAREIDLSTHGSSADQLWHHVVTAAIVLGKVEELNQYARDLYLRVGRRNNQLYLLVIGHCLHYDPHKAVAWHKQYISWGLVVPGTLRALVLGTKFTPAALAAFEAIYLDYPEPDLYDALISRLCAQRQYADALLWHFILIENMDHPSTIHTLVTLLRFLHLRGDERDATRSIWPSLHIIFSPEQCEALRCEARGHTSPETFSLPNLSVITSAKRRGKIVSDSFCARSFATRSFTPSFVINSLSLFHVEAIGPLSVREMCLSVRRHIATSKTAGDESATMLAREVAVHLDHLKTAKVDIKDCVYSKLITYLAREGHGDVLDAVLTSDQHPDVYENTDLQRRLLRSYMQKQQWTQVHRTLVILTIGLDAPLHDTWNTLLSAVMRMNISYRLAKATRIMHMMSKVGIPVWTKTIRSICNDSLPHRAKGRRQEATAYAHERLRYVTNFLLEAVKSGCYVSPAIWAEILRRHGQEGYYTELERLILWLAHHYTGVEQGTPVMSVRLHYNVGIDDIFHIPMQRAIVHWFFSAISKPQPATEDLVETHSLMKDTLPLYSHGIALIRILQDTYGLCVSSHTIRSATRLGLASLYGIATSNRRRVRIARHLNPYTFREVLANVQRAWGRELFRVPNRLRRDLSGTKTTTSAESALREVVLGYAVRRRPRATRSIRYGRYERSVVRYRGPMPRRRNSRTRLVRTVMATT